MHLQALKKYVSLLLILITVVFNASGVGFRNEVLEPLVEKSSAIALLTADDEQTEGDFKPPKNSFVDYAALCSGTVTVLEHLPPVVRLAAAEPFQYFPEVYLDIFVPPQNLA